MKIYITAPFKNGDNKEEIEKICSIVKKAGFKDFCFIRDIENYQKIFDDAHELMTRAKQEIEKCEALMIDFDGPASGRMIELGIAYALKKKIVLITKKGTKVKETISGVTDAIIEYKNIEDIIEPMTQLLLEWRKE